MVHINIEIPEDLHRQLKLGAVLREVSLKQHIISILSTAYHTSLRPARGRQRGR